MYVLELRSGQSRSHLWTPYVYCGNPQTLKRACSGFDASERWRIRQIPITCDQLLHGENITAGDAFYQKAG